MTDVTSTASVAEFHQNFWGEENKGYEVLLHNMKAGVTASKELGEFIKERVTIEDGYVKGLSKLFKSVGNVQVSTLGSFGPLWELLKNMCEKLVSVHSHFVKMLTDLNREVSEYHHSQKEKMKNNLKEEIDGAQVSLSQYQLSEGTVQRTKKQYEQCTEHFAKFQAKLDKAKAEAASNPKAKLHLSGFESRAKQAQTFMESMKGDHQNAVKKHCSQLMEFQGKMSEACMKFEACEEEHLAQMVTFMIKIARTQDTKHVSLFEVHSSLNSRLDELTVEKLLKEFVETKGTGTDKPSPYKFKPIPIEAPINVSLNVSNEDISSVGRKDSKGDSIFRKRFKKKTKTISSNGPVEITPPQIPENTPEVDEEGYSIRPEDAANIGKFPDDPANKDGSDSDSDFGEEDETESKIKKIRINTSSTKPAATVEDIKASVMSLRLGANSPVMRMATSSQSLNILAGNIAPTTPHDRIMSATSSSHNIAEEASTLIDINSSSGPLQSPLLPVSGGIPPPRIPAPLIPTTTASTTSTTIRGSSGSQIPTPLAPTAAAMVNNSNQPSLFDARRIDVIASLPVRSNLSPFSLNPAPSLSTTNTSLDSSSPQIARPRAGSIKNNTSASDISGLGSIPAPPIPTKRRSAGGAASSQHPSNWNGTPPTTTGQLLPSPLQPTETQPTSQLLPSPLQPTSLSLQSHSGSKSLDSSPILGRKNEPFSSSFLGEEHPPPPSQRGASLLHTSNPASPVPPLATPLSPLATFQMNAHSQQTGLDKPMPIAIALQESCDALFKGTDLSQCVMTVTGEVVMSFPASYLSLIASKEPLTFKINAMEKIDNILHNQLLVKKVEGTSEYRFDSEALLKYLRKMQEKSSAPFYNVQILKYKIPDSHRLPLQLMCYMKCEPSVTNFRLDYTYHSSLFQSKPKLSNVTITVPIDGGVSNALSKPMGKWSSEHNHMTWAIGDVPSSDNPVAVPLQAKFNVSNGPSSLTTSQVSFLCEGDILSGLSLDILSPGYRVSLLKKKCISGNYLVEPKK